MPSLPATIYDYSSVAGLRPDVAELFNRVYVCDGWNPTLVWDGYQQQAREAGLDRPDPYEWSAGATSTLPGSASVSPGQHFVRYRYADSKTGYPSNPSKAYQFNAHEGVSETTAGYIMSNIVPSPEAHVDQIIVEMTRAGGNQFLRATVLANESAAVTLKIADEDLASRILFYRDFGHGKPPRARYMTAFRERLWMLGDLAWSQGVAQKKANVGAAGNSIVGSGTEWNSGIKGRFFIFENDSVLRYIESVVSAAELVVTETLSGGKYGAKVGYTIAPDAPDVLYVSQALFPESFPDENRLKVLAGRVEQSTGLHGYRQDMVIFGERSMELFTYTLDPRDDGRRERVEGDRGLTSRRCTIEANGLLYGMDYKGAWVWAGGVSQGPVHLSEALDPYFDPSDRSQGYVDFQYREKFHAVHYPTQHSILWFVVMNGLPGDATTYTKPQHALLYDYLRETWTVLRFDVPIVTSTTSPDTKGRLYTLLADEHGRVWSYGIGSRDGAPGSQSRYVTLASGTSASSVVLSSDTFYASNSGLAGTPLYDPINDQVLVVRSNSAGGATLLEAPGTALSVGQRLAVGPIRGKWRTGALAFARRKERAQGRYLHLYYDPLDSGVAKVRLYRDQSGSAYQAFKYAYSNEAVHHSGSGAIDYRIDLDHYDGYARIPLAGGQCSTLEFEVIFDEGGVIPVFTGFDLDAYSREEDQEP